MDSKVSVIMGIYNCEKTIEESINSIINQSYTNWELIMCDDGSIDRTYLIAKEYQDKYPDKIKLLRNGENIKLAATLNKCLDVAIGEYIARMDADDISINDRFKKQVVFLDTHPEYQVVGGATVPFDGEKDQGVRYCVEEPCKRDLKYGTPFAHPTIMMRKKAYIKLGGYSVSERVRRCEDLDLWFRFYKEGFQGYNLQEPLLRYRESLIDYKRRKFKYAVDAFIVTVKGFRLLEFPIFYYPFAIKPLISSILPAKVIRDYHKNKDT